MLQLNAFTLVIFVVYYSMIRSDNNKKGVNDMIELMCRKCNGGDTDGKPILCDEDTVAVTCGTCSMTDLLDKMENQIMGVA